MKIYLIVLCVMAVIASNVDAQPTPQKITKVVKPQRLVSISRTVTRSVSRPRWNVSGSMARAYDKRSLINHLVKSHNMRSVDISRLSINQLWYLHDSEHDAEVKATVSNVYCPPGQT
jgi:hypothetical protein